MRPRLEKARRVEILDGDEVRTHLSKGLGFSKEDRDTNIRRIGFVARLLARNGVVAIGAAISPYASTRDEVRAAAAKDGVQFIEVHAHATIDALAARDVKGLYKKALAGEIGNFTGVSDPTRRRPTRMCRFAATRNRWTRAWRAFSASLRRGGSWSQPRWRDCRLWCCHEH